MPDNPPNDNITDDLSYNDDFGNDFYSDPFGDGGGQAPIEKHKDLLKDLTNFDPIVQRRIRNWLGLEWDDEIKDYKQKHPAIINEKGARWAIGFLQTYQSKTNFITNISQPEFKNYQTEILELVWLVFPTNDHFGVKSTADWYRLSTELQHSAFLVLAGAGDGKYTKFFGETVTRSESVNLSPQQPMRQQGGNSGGFLSGIKNKILGRG